MYLFLVRHGLTDANINNLFNGRNERDLNETGVKQAEKIAPIIQRLPIDIIISSPLKRTIHTSDILNLNHLDILLDDRIIERDFKEFTLKPMTLIQDISKLYSLDDGAQFYDIESFQSLYDRVSDFIADIKKRYSDKNILVVTHGDLIVAFQRYFEGKNPNNYPDNCKIFKYEICL
ncbi:MAG: histidine phosphatase family protein [Clostridia bacterium]|nr:histidine phosphatase family protein [Clostridia bacterium]